MQVGEFGMCPCVGDVTLDIVQVGDVLRIITRNIWGLPKLIRTLIFKEIDLIKYYLLFKYISNF